MTITETIARALIEAQGYSPSENELARARDEVPGIITALIDAGYAIVSNEELAVLYIGASGKPFHASDCATSCAPAYRPCPCDCEFQDAAPLDTKEGE